MSEDEKYFDGMPESYWRKKRNQKSAPVQPLGVPYHFRPKNINISA